VKWEVFKRNTWLPDLWCSSLRILNGTKSYCLFASQREIGICSMNKSLNNFFFEKMSLISIEYPKAATANHNQYFRRDTRICLCIFQKQTKNSFLFVFEKQKQRQTKKLPQLNWTSSGQAAMKTERNEFLFFWQIFLNFSETFAILRNIECSRKSSENPSCSLTPISLNLSPLNHFQTL